MRVSRQVRHLWVRRQHGPGTCRRCPHVHATGAVLFDSGGCSLSGWHVVARSQVWSPADGSVLAELVGHTAPVRSVCVSADGAYILTASDDGTVKVWDEQYQLARELKGHAAAVRSVVESFGAWSLIRSAMLLETTPDSVCAVLLCVGVEAA